MTVDASEEQSAEQQSMGPVTAVVGIGLLLLDLAVVFIILESLFGTNPILVFGGTAIAAVLFGGSFLFVLTRPYRDTDPEEKSTRARQAELLVAVTVLTFLTGLAGLVGVMLWIVARLGGPDPTTADGELLRTRLLNWSDRNKEFMKQNGAGEIPLEP